VRQTRSEILACAILFQREASATRCDDRLQGDQNCDIEGEQPGTFLSLLSELAEAVHSFFALKRVGTLMSF
jgi:hypothetical protein